MYDIKIVTMLLQFDRFSSYGQFSASGTGILTSGKPLCPSHVVPQFAPSPRIEGVNVAVITSYVDDSVGDGGGGGYSTFGRIVPYFHSGPRIEGVDVMIPAPDVDNPVGDGGGGVHSTFSRMVVFDSHSKSRCRRGS